MGGGPLLAVWMGGGVLGPRATCRCILVALARVWPREALFASECAHVCRPITMLHLLMH